METIRSRGERWLDVLNIVFLAGIGLICLLPFLHVLAKSLSDQASVMGSKVTFYPLGWNVEAFWFIFVKSNFIGALKVTVLVTVIGTLLSLSMTIMAAYPLSKTDFIGRKTILLLYVFSMLFYGGIIPGYILMKGLGLLDTIWAMIIPLLVVPFNLFVCKTFFEGLPDSVEESAKMDGASNMRILISIVLPISLPVVATLGIFYAVGYWNSYFHPLIFINSEKLKPLQLFLYDTISNTEEMLREQPDEIRLALSPEGLRAAAVIASIVPIMLVYPFLQRYFIHGLTIGSVKG
ncbi:putative aldouronate transport system permease protein [Paenibacillus sp. UNCCL117]|uniref:carbohydrate ABC transporter permease n=1 Tax=unclassified Paenibacillus TaxID=185978 RepID=UPI0008855F5F|nr:MULTISPECIES: carbohydrate ABC transporter permease [unclassified Paenibacillus]SDD69266.1 putative aldouronate transport system permease protein [Paenibacillus sp. cl123]SFW45109.1 putative aldouronate transport system permease protein [Paenibacillus sp. UNCCL117]